MTKMTRTEYMVRNNKRRKPTYYYEIAQGVRSGKITLYFENGKILIDDEEADAYFARKDEARLTALRPVDLFA